MKKKLLPLMLIAIICLCSILPMAVHAQAGDNTLYAGESLKTGQSLYSADGRYRLTMQYDGNLVLYTANGTALWNSGTAGRYDAKRCTMQTDGNLVIYSEQGHAIWATNTDKHGDKKTKLVLQNDRNLVIYNANGAIWSSGTWSPN